MTRVLLPEIPKALFDRLVQRASELGVALEVLVEEALLPVTRPASNDTSLLLLVCSRCREPTRHRFHGPKQTKYGFEQLYACTCCHQRRCYGLIRRPEDTDEDDDDLDEPIIKSTKPTEAHP